MKKRVVLGVLLASLSFGVFPKSRSHEFLVLDEDTISAGAKKSKKYFKRKINDLKEDIVFTCVHSLEALHFHIEQEVGLGEHLNTECIGALSRIAQRVLGLSRQIIEQEKKCFMEHATTQALTTLLATLQEIQRSIGRKVDIAWTTAQEKNLKKICDCDTIKIK
ncbi:hypothetical protein HOM50_02795 [bacterium]|jgi:hypothetical protein|nr:hypothetical protein [bacterium]MBT5015306.1 hypothetical protein [bacterium]